MHRKRKSQILEKIHGIKYTATQNQTNISFNIGMLPTIHTYRIMNQNTSHTNMRTVTTNQYFTTKPKVSKPLKLLDESWESIKKSKVSKYSIELWESTSLPTILSVQSKISGNDKYTIHTYTPATTLNLESPHIDDNFHSQNSSSVSKITNNNNINFQQILSTVSKTTKNNNNNCRESNNNNIIILSPTRKGFIKYLQLEPEPQQLLSNSYWMYNVIQFVKFLCLLKLLSQQNTGRNNIVIYSYSNTLRIFNNKIQNQTNFNRTRSSHISYQIPIHSIIFCSTYRI